MKWQYKSFLETSFDFQDFPFASKICFVHFTNVLMHLYHLKYIRGIHFYLFVLVYLVWQFKLFCQCNWKQTLCGISQRRKMQKYSSYCVAKNCQICKQTISLWFTLMFFRLKLFSVKWQKLEQNQTNTVRAIIYRKYCSDGQCTFWALKLTSNCLLSILI